MIETNDVDAALEYARREIAASGQLSAETGQILLMKMANPELQAELIRRLNALTEDSK